jgi:hypothetical protein
MAKTQVKKLEPDRHWMKWRWTKIRSNGWKHQWLKTWKPLSYALTKKAGKVQEAIANGKIIQVYKLQGWWLPNRSVSTFALHQEHSRLPLFRSNMNVQWNPFMRCLAMVGRAVMQLGNILQVMSILHIFALMISAGQILQSCWVYAKISWQLLRIDVRTTAL